MDLTSPSIIKQLLSKYGTRPSKGLGQNFLIDKNVLKKIVETADIKPSDIILEVGPGLGTLTQELAQKSKRVVAVEKDKTMIEILKETIKDFKNIEIINDDILKLDSSKLISNFKFQISNYKVVANIPYYLTSPLIRKYLELENPPEFMVLMLQKEVAQRICSKPPNMSLLAVSVQFYAEPEIISYVSKNCFWPSPKIDSAIIKITPHKKYNTSADLFFQVVKAGFSQPRKQLVNNLTSLKFLNGVKSSNSNKIKKDIIDYSNNNTSETARTLPTKNTHEAVKLTKEQISSWLLKNTLNPNQRAETLNISDWINLTKSF